MFPKTTNLSCLFLALSLTISSTFSTSAENLDQKPQVPGYYRFSVGDFQITALLDGTGPMEREMFFGISDAEKDELLSRMFISGPVPSCVNSYLINTGSKLVLIDAGSGNTSGPQLGHLPENLKAAGYKPCKIDAVLITHAHPDHIGGLLDAEGQPVFPRATVYMSVPEAAFWLSNENKMNAPEALKPLFEMAQRVESVYSAMRKWKTFYDGDSPVNHIEGIRAILTPGHTPGMSAFEVSSNNQTLLIWGDVVHSTAIQMPRPFVGFAYDLDISGAITTRLNQLESVANDKISVVGSHLPFPGIGHVRKDGQQTYTWVPMEFSATTY